MLHRMSEEVLIVQVYKPHTSVKGFGLRFVDVVLYTGAAYLDSLSKTGFGSFHRSMTPQTEAVASVVIVQSTWT